MRTGPERTWVQSAQHGGARCRHRESGLSLDSREWQRASGPSGCGGDVRRRRAGYACGGESSVARCLCQDQSFAKGKWMGTRRLFWDERDEWDMRSTQRAAAVVAAPRGRVFVKDNISAEYPRPVVPAAWWRHSRLGYRLPTATPRSLVDSMSTTRHRTDIF